jgi:hypothetical protein
VIGHYLKHLGHDVGVQDLATEDANFVGKPDDAQGEIIHALAILEGDVIEVLQELLGVDFPNALHADAHRLHRVPGRARRAFARKGPEHLRWDGTEDGRDR